MSVDRAHRLGRERAVFVYKLICDNTVEEKIERMKDRKGQLAEALLADDPDLSARLTDLDLRSLFDLSSLDPAPPLP